MAERPVFFIEQGKVRRRMVEFEWFPGFSVSQKQKSIASFHAAIRRKYPGARPLEISTKGTEALGVKMSAFNLRLDASACLQGVIDLCFLEDGQWVLADYKTDFISGQELVARYSLQVRWYAHALAVITGTPVKEAWLFGLRAGKAWPVSLEEEVGEIP